MIRRSAARWNDLLDPSFVFVPRTNVVLLLLRLKLVDAIVEEDNNQIDSTREDFIVKMLGETVA